jgi:hypothetical protein
VTVTRARTWHEWLYQTFVRHGYFAVRPLPSTEAERQEGVENTAPPKDITKLNLDSGPTRSID